VPWTDEERKTFQCSSKSPSTSPLYTTPPVALGGSATAAINRNQPRLTRVRCWLVQYCGQSRFAPYCERQDALLKNRRVYVEDAPSKTPSRTAPVARPSSYHYPEITQHSHFHLPSLVRPHIHDYLVTAPLHLRHICTTYLPPYPLPLTHLNNQLHPRLPAETTRLADAPIFTTQTRTRRGKPKATCTTPREGY